MSTLKPTLSTQTVADVTIFGFVRDPAFHPTTQSSADRPVHFGDGNDLVISLLVPAVKKAVAEGAKKILVNLRKVYLVTEPVLYALNDSNAIVSKAGGQFLICSVPTVVRDKTSYRPSGFTAGEINAMVSAGVTIDAVPRYLDMSNAGTEVDDEEDALDFFNPLFTATARPTDGEESYSPFDMMHQLFIVDLKGIMKDESRDYNKIISTLPQGARELRLLLTFSGVTELDLHIALQTISLLSQIGRHQIKLLNPPKDLREMTEHYDIESFDDEDTAIKSFG